MTFVGNFVRRHFEPLLLSFQVLVDLAVVLLACVLGYLIGKQLGGTGPTPPIDVYRWLWAMTGVVCLCAFYAFGMYKPVKSLLNVEENKSILKSTVISFLVLQTLLIFMHTTKQDPQEGSLYGWIVPIHRFFDVRIDPFSFSRLTVVTTFFLILILTTVSRFASFKLIQTLHKRGIGNRNVLIFGTGNTATWLQRKFVLVPTLGLRLVGFVTEQPQEVGRRLNGSLVLGTLEDLPRLVSQYKISEAFVAMPEMDEERLLQMVARLEELGVTYRVVPRFYHLLSQRVRIETLDSIPLISRAERRQSWMRDTAKRSFDIAFSLVALVLTAPLFLIIAFLIKRESQGGVFFRQTRIGQDGKPFQVLKFRTMYSHMSGDAPTPRDDHDPRVTPLGRILRRTSLDELPQFLNVIKGQMSIVGPRPEMSFIVATYGAMGRERLRVKPGITGLWQVSSARQQAIHETLDYDIYYVENHSILLDMVIISLTLPAMIRGTGAH